MTDINKPDYYASGQIETKDFIRDKDLNFFLGNVIKYVVRAGKKDKSKHIEDLEKARNYLDFEIEHVEKQEEVNDIDSEFKIFSSGKQPDLITTLDELGYKKIDDLTEFAEGNIILSSPLLCNDSEIASSCMYRYKYSYKVHGIGRVIDVFDSKGRTYAFELNKLIEQDYYIKKGE